MNQEENCVPKTRDWANLGRGELLLRVEVDFSYEYSFARQVVLSVYGLNEVEVLPQAKKRLRRVQIFGANCLNPHFFDVIRNRSRYHSLFATTRG